MKKLIHRTLLIFIILLLTSNFAYAEKYEDSIMSFEIPAQLELKNETWTALSDKLEKELLPTGKPNGAIKVILQQKGLNALSEEAFQNYSRIIITATPTKTEENFTNAEFKNEFDSYSDDQKDAMFNTLQQIFSAADGVVEILDHKTTTISGLFALNLTYIRESINEEKGKVFVEWYYFFVDGYNFVISCSYRLSSKDLFAPAMDEFLNTFKINIKERVSNIEPTQKVKGEPRFYKQTLPWTSESFLWPEQNIFWEQTSDSDGTYKIANFDNDTYNIGLVVTNLKTRATSFNKNSTLKLLKKQLEQKHSSSLSMYNYKVIENEIKNNILYTSYEYDVYGIKIFGKAYYRFLDNYRLAGFECEYFEKGKDVIEKISNSLGF